MKTLHCHPDPETPDPETSSGVSGSGVSGSHWEEILKPLNQVQGQNDRGKGFSDETQENHQFARIKLFLYLGLKEEALNEILWVRNDINGDKEKAILIASILSSIGEYHRALYTIREYIPGNMSAGLSIDARLWRLIYPAGYNDLINRYADENKVDPLMLYALIREESWFNKDAVSPAGAVGLMQLMPKTAAMLAIDSYKGRDSLFDPELNIGLGTRFFADRLKQFDGNIFMAIASYNAGPDAVSQWLKEREGFELDEFIEDIPYRETRNYVKKVFRSYMEYQRLNNDEAQLTQE